MVNGDVVHGGYAQDGVILVLNFRNKAAVDALMAEIVREIELENTDMEEVEQSNGPIEDAAPETPRSQKPRRARGTPEKVRRKRSDHEADGMCKRPFSGLDLC